MIYSYFHLYSFFDLYWTLKKNIKVSILEDFENVSGVQHIYLQSLIVTKLEKYVSKCVIFCKNASSYNMFSNFNLWWIKYVYNYLILKAIKSYFLKSFLGGKNQKSFSSIDWLVGWAKQLYISAFIFERKCSIPIKKPLKNLRLSFLTTNPI